MIQLRIITIHFVYIIPNLNLTFETDIFRHVLNIIQKYFRKDQSITGTKYSKSQFLTSNKLVNVVIQMGIFSPSIETLLDSVRPDKI